MRTHISVSFDCYPAARSHSSHLEKLLTGRLTDNNVKGNIFFKSVFHKVWPASVFLVRLLCDRRLAWRQENRNLPQVAPLHLCLGEGFYCVHAALLSLDWHQDCCLKLSLLDIIQPSCLSCLLLIELRSVLVVLTCRATADSVSIRSANCFISFCLCL